MTEVPKRQTSVDWSKIYTKMNQSSFQTGYIKLLFIVFVFVCARKALFNSLVHGIAQNMTTIFGKHARNIGSFLQSICWIDIQFHPSIDVVVSQGRLHILYVVACMCENCAVCKLYYYIIRPLGHCLLGTIAGDLSAAFLVSCSLFLGLMVLCVCVQFVYVHKLTHVCLTLCWWWRRRYSILWGECACQSVHLSVSTCTVAKSLNDFQHPSPLPV